MIPVEIPALKDHLSEAIPTNKQVLQKNIKIIQGHQHFVPKTVEIGKVRLTEGKAVKLQPNSETILWEKAKYGPNGRKYDALIETNLISIRHELVVASALVTVTNGRVPLRV